MTFQDKIEQTISQTDCPKNFKCKQNNYVNICKARYIGEGNKKVLECIDEEDLNCNLAIRLNGARYCGCRVRALVAQELGI